MFKLSPSICGQVLLSFTVSEFSCNTLLTRINQIHFRCTRFARFSFTHIDFGTMAKDVTSKHNIFVYITVIMFGTGSWVATNGIWVELPVMVPHLNEGWTLPSYLSILIQLANIGPLAVAVSNIIAPGKLKEKPVVFGIISIGTIACFLLAFFWKTSIYLVGAERSIALLILQFMIALVNCTSSVVFLPFMAIFKPQYIIAYFIGQGMSGLLPGVVALGQGVGKMTCQNRSLINITSNSTSYSVQPVFAKPKISVQKFSFSFCLL